MLQRFDWSKVLRKYFQTHTYTKHEYKPINYSIVIQKDIMSDYWYDSEMCGLHTWLHTPQILQALSGDGIINKCSNHCNWNMVLIIIKIWNDNTNRVEFYHDLSSNR